MQRLGFLLFLAGVILAAWFAARPADVAAIGADPGAVTAMERIRAWGQEAGFPFAAGVVLMVVGGVLARRGGRGHATAGAAAPVADGNTRSLMTQFAAAVSALPEGDAREHAQSLHAALDRILEELVPAYLEQREAMVAELGILRYAELSNELASAERSLARAWSALTDEAWFEVAPCLDVARGAAQRALAIVEATPGA